MVKTPPLSCPMGGEMTHGESTHGESTHGEFGSMVLLGPWGRARRRPSTSSFVLVIDLGGGHAAEREEDREDASVGAELVPGNR